eukprot:scaffold53398_cov32-Prasinocladus_malaysianus.AAC.1
MDVHELGNVAVPVDRVLGLEGIAQRSALLGDNIPLVGGRLGLSNRLDELPQTDGHGGCRLARGLAP